MKKTLWTVGILWFLAVLLMLLFYGVCPGCGGSGPDWSSGMPVSVEGWHPSVNAQSNPDRITLIKKVVASSTADVLCLHAAFAVQADLAAAAKPNYGYSFTQSTDEKAQPADQTDINGQPVPLRTTPACTMPKSQQDIATEATCLEANCSTLPGSNMGRVSDGDCAQSKCLSGAIGLLGNDTRCYSCAITNLFLDQRTIQESVDRCENYAQADIGWAGQNGELMLSRYPLSNPQLYVLPSSAERQVVLAATVTLPGGASFEAFCTELTFPATGLVRPYAGQWGNGEGSDLGWVNEEQLQARDLVAFVKARSGSRPAVIAGQVWGSHQVDDASGVHVVTGNGAEPVLTSLEMAFTEAVPAGFVPQCTRCPDNPYYKQPGIMSPDPWWSEHVFLYNVPSVAVTVAAIEKHDEMAPFGPNFPPSNFWGFRSTVKIAK